MIRRVPSAVNAIAFTFLLGASPSTRAHERAGGEVDLGQ